MRTLLGRFVVTLLAAAHLSAAADVVVLKDGRVLSLAKPYVVKGGQAVLTLSDGRLVSVRVDQIDAAKTQEAQAAPVPAATPPAAKATPQPSIAGAAKSSTGKKASIILTDADVAAGSSSETATGKGEVKIEVVGQSFTRGSDGYVLTAQVVNSGTAPAEGLTVSVEAIGEGNITIASVFSQIAKTTLGPKERSALTATVQTDKVVKTFRFVPKWTVSASVRPASEAGGTGGKASGQPTPGTPLPQAPRPEPKKPEQPEYVPRPDYAAPPASAPLGSPKSPGSGYIPTNSNTSQPKPPGGR